MIERMDMLKTIAENRTNEVVVMTMTTTLQWPLVSDHDLDFDFLAFGMGHAADFAMGIALSQPERKTIVFKGDGGLLMSLGSMITLSKYAPENMLIFLLENRCYEMVGGQGFSQRVDFEKIASGSGFEGGGRTGKGKIEKIDNLQVLQDSLPRLLSEPGPHFVIVPVKNSEKLPPVNHSDHAERIIKLRTNLLQK
ncbi:MAG: thiamine pyrophosphate-dependent enzyme [Nitrospinota bacterium]|nr:thiamine pyrophosphate-dependent enzyme [Nitrospinota bacterium]